MIRVTRLMEYEFATVEQALASMEVWAVPAHGVRSFGGRSEQPGGVVIRSAVIGPVFGEAAERIHTAIGFAEESDPADESGPVATEGRAKVILFKPSGKYYTEEEWTVPDPALGPYDMAQSPDFRRISGGAVLVVSQEPWGYPFLFSAVSK
jgi:hypothetical protein